MAVRYRYNYLLAGFLFVGTLVAIAVYSPETIAKEMGKIRVGGILLLSVCVAGAFFDIFSRLSMKLTKEEKAVGSTPLLSLTFSMPPEETFNLCCNTLRELPGFKITEVEPDEGKIRAVKQGKFANVEIISIAIIPEEKITTKVEIISLNQNTVQFLDFGSNISNIREIESGLNKVIPTKDRDLKSSTRVPSKAAEDIIVIKKNTTFGFFDSIKGTAKAMALVLSVVLLIALIRSAIH